MKHAKSAVGYEHPAKASNHCGICVNFEAPDACRIVRGEIRRQDWCKRFASRRDRRAKIEDEHYSKISRATD